MLLLTTTSDLIRVITDAAVTVDCHASWIDRSGGSDTAGSTNTPISTMGTTTIVAAPAGSTTRNIRRMIIRNRSAASSVTVTIQLYNGVAFELDKRVLGPGQALEFNDAAGFFPQPAGGVQTRPWFGQLAGCFADGDPGHLMYECQRGGTVANTPTGITTTLARCSAFMLPYDLTFNRIRAFGMGTHTNVFRVAIYRMSDLARLTAELVFSTAADTWVSIGSALNVTLSKDVMYFAAVAVNATSTTSGILSMGTTTAAGTTGRVNTAPGSLPGSMVLGATNYMGHYQFGFAVTAGALPDPAAALIASGTGVGGAPALWLDAADV